MLPWEKRLKDLGHVLKNCSETYFEPDLFRLNTNHFLTTARTVTFIIQKNKSDIDDFESWYEKHVLEPWSRDPIMKWAKDSRNTIEKIGDLELYSEADVRLIFSYIEDEDIQIECPGESFIGYSIKKLIRYAQKQLPSGISDAALVKIERRWVANNLDSQELLDAMVYVYGRIYDCCKELGEHVGTPIDRSIPETISFDQVQTDSKNIRYVKLNELVPSSLKTKDILVSSNDDLPPEAVRVINEIQDVKRPESFEENHEYYSLVAKKTFESHGNHVPMLFLFDANLRPIDFLSTQFEDTASKYIFWRRVADRFAYLKPTSLIWISEAWTRKLDKDHSKPIRSLEITGELLQICSFEINKRLLLKSWIIERKHEDDLGVIVGEENKEFDPINPPLNFLRPVISAFNKFN